jgi:hypothetical protein
MDPWFRPKLKLVEPKLVGPKLRMIRCEPRYTVPVLSVRIMAVLSTTAGTYHGLLWDISTRGACVRSYEPIPTDIFCTLRLYQHAGSQVVERKARLLWSDAVMRAHYVGMSFDEPIPVDSSTFLGTLMLNARSSQDGAE